MRKLQTMLAAALILGMSGVAPAQADDAGNDVRSMAKSAAWFPVQAVGVAAAIVVGTPIAVTRRAAVRIHEYTSTGADKIGGHDHFPPVLFASVFGVPAGALVGGAEGVYAGTKNAISHGVEKPFSLDSMSLGDDLDK